jgi:hypothetical protein
MKSNELRRCLPSLGVSNFHGLPLELAELRLRAADQEIAAFERYCKDRSHGFDISEVEKTVEQYKRALDRQRSWVQENCPPFDSVDEEPML